LPASPGWRLLGLPNETPQPRCLAVSIDLFIQALRRHAVEGRQISIDDDLFATNQENSTFS
jgi:hypothetical protein